jgi:hypothetical protein
MKMTKTRVRRCTSADCRTLTANLDGRCDRHRSEQVEQAALPAPSESAAFDYAMWRREHQAEQPQPVALPAIAERRHDLAERRGQLEGLRLAARRADRANEQPRFPAEISA